MYIEFLKLCGTKSSIIDINYLEPERCETQEQKCCKWCMGETRTMFSTNITRIKLMDNYN